MKKEGLVIIFLRKKQLVVFKLLMLLLACICILPIWDGLDNGYVITKGNVREKGSLIFYLYFLKYFLAAMLFLWLATGGSREKE